MVDTVRLKFKVWLATPPPRLAERHWVASALY
jgi:hypothetical protein